MPRLQLHISDKLLMRFSSLHLEFNSLTWSNVLGSMRSRRLQKRIIFLSNMRQSSPYNPNKMLLIFFFEQQFVEKKYKNMDKTMDGHVREMQRKITRAEQEYQDLLIKTEYLKTQKHSIKKQIQFYKAAIGRLAFIYDIATD